MNFKKLIHGALAAFGLELRFKKNLVAARLKEREERAARAWDPVAALDLTHILDIGANNGQFAAIARRLFPQARIVSFEPLPDAYKQLTEKMKADERFRAEQVALGAGSGKAQINKCEFTPSSSLLSMAELHRSEFPHTEKHTLVEVDITSLDEWVSAQRFPIGSKTLVKIDTQGYEDKVLDGGVRALRAAGYALLEVSYYELYEGQPLFADINRRMEELGYVFRGLLEQTADHGGTRFLFADALYENASPNNWS